MADHFSTAHAVIKRYEDRSPQYTSAVHFWRRGTSCRCAGTGVERRGPRCRIDSYPVSVEYNTASSGTGRCLSLDRTADINRSCHCPTIPSLLRTFQAQKVVDLPSTSSGL